MSDLRSRLKRLLVATVAVAALAGAGVGIAAGLGAFNGPGPFSGVSAAQRLPTAAEERVAASLGLRLPVSGVKAGSVRFVAQRYGIRIYAAASTTGRLCVIAYQPLSHGTFSEEVSCPRLSHKIPIFIGIDNTSVGIALDNVTAVSFMAGGQEVTVPVKNNAWAYQGNAVKFPLTVHFPDGSTQQFGSG